VKNQERRANQDALFVFPMKIHLLERNEPLVKKQERIPISVKKKERKDYIVASVLMLDLKERAKVYCYLGMAV